MYYSYRLDSQKNPSIFLSIVHDKMDKSKTSILRLEMKSKDIINFMNLPISLIGMLTHGHKTGGFGHFNLSIQEIRLNL